MTTSAAAPSQAGAPTPWERAILHARIPAALKLLLLALLAALPWAAAPRRPLRALRQDWLFSTHADLNDDLDSAQDPYALRRILQLRAELGWLMRGKPNRGMALSGHRAPALRPVRAARAPPSGPQFPLHPESVAKTPLPAAMTHARAPALPRQRHRPP